jgi:hypothetical protein
MFPVRSDRQFFLTDGWAETYLSEALFKQRAPQAQRSSNPAESGMLLKQSAH